MSAITKAEQLIKKHLTAIAEESMDCDKMIRYGAIQCAIVSVNELIQQNGEIYLYGINEKYYRKKNNYLFEVKQELEKLKTN